MGFNYPDSRIVHTLEKLVTHCTCLASADFLSSNKIIWAFSLQGNNNKVPRSTTNFTWMDGMDDWWGVQSVVSTRRDPILRPTLTQVPDREDLGGVRGLVVSWTRVPAVEVTAV